MLEGAYDDKDDDQERIFVVFEEGIHKRVGQKGRDEPLEISWFHVLRFQEGVRQSKEVGWNGRRARPPCAYASTKVE